MFQIHFTDCLNPSFFSTPMYTQITFGKVVVFGNIQNWSDTPQISRKQLPAHVKQSKLNLNHEHLIYRQQFYFPAVIVITQAWVWIQVHNNYTYTLQQKQKHSPQESAHKASSPKAETSSATKPRWKHAEREYQRKETKREKRGYATLVCLPHRRWWGGQVGAGRSGQSSADFKITFLSSTVVHILKFRMRSLRKQLQQWVSWSENDTQTAQKNVSNSF